MARAPTITVRLEGGDELRRKLERVQAAARGPTMEKALMPAAKLIRDAARERAPVMTGRYRASIEAQTQRVTSEGVEIAVGSVARRRSRPYWMEYGVKKRRRITKRKVLYSRTLGRFLGREVGPSPARPHLRPAFNEQKQRAFQLAAENLRRLLERA